MKDFKAGIIRGLGMLLVFGTAVFAYTVSGTIKTWTSNEILTAADLNNTIQALKTSIENAAQLHEDGATYYGSAATYRWAKFLSVGSTYNSEQSTRMPRGGTVKNFKLKPTSNDINAACTFTLRKNGADTNISVAIPQGSTTEVAATNTVTFAADDLLGWQITCTGASSGSIGYNVVFEF